MLLPAGASAATLVSPANGSTIDGSRAPQYQWTLSAGEEASSIIAANYADVISGNSLNYRSGTGIRYDSPTITDRTATGIAGGPLYAGKHYWALRASDASFNLAAFGPNVFTVRPLMTMGSLGVSVNKRKTTVTVAWNVTSNIRDYAYTVTIKRNGRRVIRKRLAEVTLTTEAYRKVPNGGTLYEYGIGRYASGTRFEVLVEMRGGGLARTRSATYRVR